MLADLSIVQKQSITWLSRRFGFQHQLSAFLSARGGEALGLEDSPLNRLPTWRRRATILRRALLSKDSEARGRLVTSLGVRFFPNRLRVGTPQPLLALDSDVIDRETYTAWIARYDALTDADRTLIAAGIAAGALPELLVVVRFTGGAVGRVGPIVARLQDQLYGGWRALFSLDDDVGPGAARSVAASAAVDRRIRVLASRQLEAEGLQANGPIVLAEPHVVLRPETLFAFAEAARDAPSLRLIYADEDRLEDDGERHSPAFKPRFSPALNQRLDYLGDCVCVAGSAVRHLPASGSSVAAWAGQFASGLDPQEVGRIERVLFHVQGDIPPPCRHTEAAPAPRADEPSVAILIPTRNHAALLSACVESIRTRTRYPHDKLRIVLVDNGSDEAPALELLERLGRDERIRVISDPRPFNYARLNNVAARAAASEVLVFLNNDTEVTDPEWLATLARLAAQPDVGVVGLKLLYPDGTIQHGGVVLGIGGVAGHSFVGLDAASDGYLGLASVTREISAVTGACMAVRRSVFEQIGGFDEQLEIAFNDTALCCEALRLGYRNLYAGETSLLHHESKTRGFDDTPEKLARFRLECVHVRGRYKDLFDADPYYSANLGLERQYQPAIPRTRRIWSKYRRTIDRNPRVLILSAVHATGHGVPVVAKQHAEYLAAQGCTVFVGGPMQANEVSYDRCLRVYLDNPLEAQSFAYETDVDCVMAHTMPFFSMFRTMSDYPRRVIFDHGEPPPAWFPNDQRDRENIDAEKQFCYRFAELVLTNTATVKDEIGYDRAEVAGLGNSHLATWDPAKALRRDAIRAQLGLDGKFVVLNVCRFHRPERRYKGIGDYVELKRRIGLEHPALAERIAFVLCGKGTDTDREEMVAEGLVVFSNVSDQDLADLYVAADLYANFSKWEGFNLGIAQALAMGLGAIASDIPAHRQFPIATADDEGERAQLLADAVARQDAGGVERRPVLMSWEPLLEWLHRRIVQLCDAPV
jgi:GT2 family glycosyltransferase